MRGICFQTLNADNQVARALLSVEQILQYTIIVKCDVCVMKRAVAPSFFIFTEQLNKRSQYIKGEINIKLINLKKCAVLMNY